MSADLHNNDRMASPLPLDEFPRPNVAVDAALVTVTPPSVGRPRRLCVLVSEQQSGSSSLPGTFVRERTTIDATLERLFRDKVGVQLAGLSGHLLKVFDAPDRDPRGTWTMSIAYAVALPADRASDAETAHNRWVPIGADGVPSHSLRLDYDHAQIVEHAADLFRRRYETHPDPDFLLPHEFTLAELQEVHEAVLGSPLRFDTFKRRMLTAGLVRTGTRPPTGRGRPAVLYSRESPDGVPESFRLPRADHGR